MSEKSIEKMDFKELRQEVQLLRDELALMKRKYEDIIHNLDEDNFGANFKVELGDKFSSIEQTADEIKSVVSKNANLKEATLITSLDEAKNKDVIYKIQEKNADGDIIGERYYYYSKITKNWEKLSGDSIYTVFSQTADGFSLKGNVLIDGNTVITKNLNFSGNVTWEMENTPVLTQYSSDNKNWHSPMASGDMYMRMSFDGGVNWSTSTKVVGTDGRNGSNGSDANVTPENVFNALTDNGAQQGIFAAFINNEDKLYINAEYIAGRIANVADTLYVGEDSANDAKMIVFNNTAKISTIEGNTTGVYTALSISAERIQLGGSSYIYFGKGSIVDFFGANVSNLYAVFA